MKKEICKRNISLDLLRIYSCFCIIVLHASSFVINHQRIWSAYQTIVRPCLWVFALLSGYFILCKNIPNMKSFYFKRVVTLIIPLLGYSALYQIINYGIQGLNPRIFVPAFLSNQIGGHFWYVYTLLGLYLASPFLKIMLDILNDNQLVFFIILVGFFTCMPDYLSFVKIEWAVDIIFSGVFFFYYVLGYVLWRMPTDKFQGIIICLGVMNVFITYLFSSKNVLCDNLYTSSINMMIGSVFYFVLFSKIKIPHIDICKKIIIYVSNKTYGIYLIHILVLDIINQRGLFSATEKCPLLKPLIDSGIIFICSFLIAIIVDFILIRPLIKICNLFFITKIKGQ